MTNYQIKEIRAACQTVDLRYFDGAGKQVARKSQGDFVKAFSSEVASGSREENASF